MKMTVGPPEEIPLLRQLRLLKFGRTETSGKSEDVKLTQGKIIGGLAVAGVLIVAACVGIWFLFLDGDAPAPVSLEEAVASLGTPTEVVESDDETPLEDRSDSDPTATEVRATPTATEPPTAASSEGGTDSSVPTEAPTATAATSLAVNWQIAEEAESFVGYRIGEELATIGTTEAVGRTSEVAGTVAINGSIVVSATFEADMQALTSDDSRRDNTLGDRGLETNLYPTATFNLTRPIDLGSELMDGAIYSVMAAGDLTLHGTTRPVEIQMETQYVSGALVVVESLEIELADYNITPPTTRIALAVDDHGTMEMQLILIQSS